jgi:hypothetical protein
MIFAFACKKETKKNTTTEQTSTGTPTLPASNFKRVKSIRDLDTLTNKVKLITYDYNYTTGTATVQTVIDSFPPNPTPAVNVSSNTYSYNSSNRVSHILYSSSSYTMLTSFIYDSTNKVTKRFEMVGTSTGTVNYSHSGNTTWETSGSNVFGYTDGDLTSYTYYWQSSPFTTTYTYSSTLLDKSKQFFNETSFLPAACKLLTSYYIPAGPSNPNGPTTVTVTYTFDGDGYPVTMRSSNSKIVRTFTYL